MPVAEPTLLPTNEHPSLRWLGLTGAATALQVARAATQATGPILLVTGDAATAARLEEELAFFCAGAVPIFGFPGYETLPYDQFSPHPDIISQRLRTMARLPALKRGIVIVDVQTVLQRLPPRTFIDGHALSLKAGEALDLEQFRLRLSSAGYASVPQVGEPGEEKQSTAKCATEPAFEVGKDAASPRTNRFSYFGDRRDRLSTGMKFNSSPSPASATTWLPMFNGTVTSRS